MSEYEIKPRVVIANILHIDDPDGDWHSEYRDRVLPDECECPARYYEDDPGYIDGYECDCSPDFLVECWRRKTTIWEVILLGTGSEILGKGEGQSQEQAHVAAIADAVARRLNAIPDHPADR